MKLTNKELIFISMVASRKNISVKKKKFLN